MPRYTASQLRQIDEQQRHVITQKPMTVAGGNPLLIPLIAAAAAPFLGKAGSWVGHKVFGNGVLQSGASRPPVNRPLPMNHAGMGILRAGERLPQRPVIQGSGLADRLQRVGVEPGKKHAPRDPNYRAGDYKMSSMMPLPNYKTGTGGIQGGMIAQMPGVPDKVKSVVAKLTALGGGSKKRKSKKKPHERANVKTN